MKLRWSNGSSRSVEFDAGKRSDFAMTLENAMLSYRQPLAVESRVMVFRRTSSGRIGAVLGDRYWQSQHVWRDLDDARRAIVARELYVPPDVTVEYRVVDDIRAYIANFVATNERRVSEVAAAIRARGHTLAGDIWSTHNDRDALQLHVEASPDHWVDPIFPPAPHSSPIYMPCDYCNGQPTPDGYAEIQLSRQTHVIQSESSLYGGHPVELVHPHGYHDSPEPTLCGLYWADWCLKIGPGHWHAGAVYDACLSAIGATNQLTGFIADVCDAALGPAAGDA